MASTDARPVPRKNVAYRAYFPILDADGDLVTGAASLDSEVSIDGGNFADCTNEATEIQSTGTYYLDLTSGEMNGDAVVVIVKTATSGAKTTVLTFYPEEVGDFRVNVEQFGGSTGTFSGGRPEVNTTHAAGTAWGSGAITAAAIATGAIDADAIADNAIDAGAIAADAITSTKIADNAITAAKLASDAITAAKLHSDVTTELQNGLATASALATVDTVVDAILALLDDARGEPGQGAPPVNPDLATKLDYLYKWARNKRDNNGTENRYYADDGSTVDQKQTTAESGGTVTVGEMATGA